MDLKAQVGKHVSKLVLESVIWTVLHIDVCVAFNSGVVLRCPRRSELSW